jgi:hypothetical protein
MGYVHNKYIKSCVGKSEAKRLFDTLVFKMKSCCNGYSGVDLEGKDPIYERSG